MRGGGGGGGVSAVDVGTPEADTYLWTHAHTHTHTHTHTCKHTHIAIQADRQRPETCLLIDGTARWWQQEAARCSRLNTALWPCTKQKGMWQWGCQNNKTSSHSSQYYLCNCGLWKETQPEEENNKGSTQEASILILLLLQTLVCLKRGQCQGRLETLRHFQYIISKIQM